MHQWEAVTAIRSGCDTGPAFKRWSRCHCNLPPLCSDGKGMREFCLCLELFFFFFFLLNLRATMKKKEENDD